MIQIAGITIIRLVAWICSLCWTSSQFAQYISTGNPGISSDICRCCYIYLSVHNVLIYCWLCFVCKKLLLSCVFLKSLVICLTSSPHYTNVAHFVLWCFGSSCMFCFCGCDSGVSSRFVLYSFFCICFHSVFSVCLDFFVIGYMLKRFTRYLIPDSLCSYGWHELLSIIISVWVGCLYIENSNLLSLQYSVIWKFWSLPNQIQAVSPHSAGSIWNQKATKQVL
jgi:hypothetical protein